MPHSERPSSPEEHISDQYFIYRLEHDLYELFEEQQLLLDIVAQQQERLERQLEMQRLLLSEPPARLATPLPELLPLPAPQPLQLEEINTEMAPEPASAVEPELLAIAEADEQASTLFKCPELVPPLPPPRCICTQMQRQARRGYHQVAMPFLQDSKGAKCTPPKRSGLGYDAPFPYPKRMAKSRERRALFIFTLVDNLVLQLQRCMSLAETGALPLPLAMPGARASNVVIVELEPPKKEAAYQPSPPVTVPTGALPKPKFNHMEISAKRSPRTKAAKRLHKQLKKTSSQLDTEIDLDCEFGMDHIEKFRADRVRDDEHNRFKTMPIRKHKRQSSQGMVLLAEEVLPSDKLQTAQGVQSPIDSRFGAGTEDIDNEVLAVALASLAISEDPNPQAKLTVPGWYENCLAAPESQLETRPCTPEMAPFSLLPTGLHSNGFISLMPSTSAQARALSLAMSGRRPESSHSSSPPSPLSSRSPMSSLLQQNPVDSIQTLPDRFSGISINQLAFAHVLDANGNKVIVPRQSVNENEFNAGSCGGYRLGCGQPMCSTGLVSSPLPPGPPPPSPVYNHFTYDNINPLPNLSGISNGKENGNIQSTRMDICGEDYAASSPDHR
ncbi:uncharacterized protein [Drosophila virilis]|uniref:Uncharacterized protein n=1 Tax=Drosophila virilis TaxID=7244 RepID=B4M3H1_DROVI|nr:uncharacterized protein LOC6631689 isoform X2 [Drosophila virilis]EDW65346.2 uncharacterized protein Dvir_GJ18958 [Drosophila virilis]